MSRACLKCWHACKAHTEHGFSSSILNQYTCLSLLIIIIFQVSPTAGSPALSDATKYPNFARLAPSGVVIAYGVVALMKQYGWSRVAAITQQEFLFTKVYTELSNAVAQEGDDWAVYNAQFATDEDPWSYVTNMHVCVCVTLVYMCVCVYENHAQVYRL